jgi:PhoH-like ATPase
LVSRNKEQTLAIDLLLDDSIKLVTLIGKAGSGKTLLSVAAGLNLVLEKKKYKSLVICRPVVPVGNDLGFLPGTKEEKLEPWIAPIKDNLRHLLFSGRKGKLNEETLQNYFDNGIIEVEAITYLRGRSIADALIIIDEAQNLTAHELKTIITRVGDNTKIILTGDVEQIDNMYIDSVSNGLAIAVEKFKPFTIAGHITLLKGERSALATLAANLL